MRIIITAFLTASLAALAAGPASAQSAPVSRFGVGGTVGFGETWDDEGSLGSGWLAGGYVDWRVFGKTDLEVGLDVLRHDRSGGYFEAEGHTTFVSAALLRRFGSDRTNGYLLGGGIIGAHRGTTSFPADGFTNSHESTDWGFVFGGGFAFRARNRIEMGPVFRMTLMSIDTDSDPAIVIMTGFRIGIRQ